jgi:hypothetical protein
MKTTSEREDDMAVLIITVLLWCFAGWKWALCLLLPALGVESVWRLKRWHDTPARYDGDTHTRAAIDKLGEKLSTSALAESGGILDEIQALIEEHNRTYPEDLWAGVADVRDEMVGKGKVGN